MAYRVTVLPRAKLQLLEQCRWWSEHHSAEQAFRWLDGFEAELGSLTDSPDRCVVTRESDQFDVTIRELHFGLGSKPTHRAVFEIRGDEVVVYAIRHLAQRDLRPDDLVP